MITEFNNMTCRDKKQVAVCMSTYNGEKYLREQLDSILGQSYKKLWLLIRDDGSQDSTVTIIKEYCNSYNNIVLVSDNYGNIGPTYSFLSLIRYAYHSEKNYQYYAFADQDDVWLENKIMRAVHMLENAERQDCGRLYYSNKTVVDSDLHKMYDEEIHYYGDFLECLFTSLASGCTMLFDRKVAELLSSHLPLCYCFHDSWTYRLCKALSCEIVFDDERGILYRQHNQNVVGIIKPKDAGYYLKAFKSMLFSKSDPFLQKVFSEIAEVFPDELQKSKEKDIVYSVLNYRKSFTERMKLLRIEGLNKRSKVVQLSWYYKVLWNMI